MHIIAYMRQRKMKKKIHLSLLYFVRHMSHSMRTLLYSSYGTFTRVFIGSYVAVGENRVGWYCVDRF